MSFTQFFFQLYGIHCDITNQVRDDSFISLHITQLHKSIAPPAWCHQYEPFTSEPMSWQQESHQQQVHGTVKWHHSWTQACDWIIYNIQELWCWIESNSQFYQIKSVFSFTKNMNNKTKPFYRIQKTLWLIKNPGSLQIKCVSFFFTGLFVAVLGTVNCRESAASFGNRIRTPAVTVPTTYVWAEHQNQRFHACIVTTGRKHQWKSDEEIQREVKLQSTCRHMQSLIQPGVRASCHSNLSRGDWVGLLRSSWWSALWLAGFADRPRPPECDTTLTIAV